MIEDFKPGLRIKQPVIARVQKIGTSSNGAPFARGLVEDNSGCVPFICFEVSPIEKLKELEGPSAIIATGMVDINKYSNDMSLQLMLQKVDKPGAEDDLSHLLPQGNIDLQEWEAKLNELVESIADVNVADLVTTVLSGDTYAQFIINPAGMRLHHAYVGGLMHHSVSVAQIARALATTIPQVDLDLVTAGALLHDVGKIDEISSDLGFPYTTTGRLMGHIALGALRIREAAQQVPNLSRNQLEALEHIILSHHGSLDKGSPVACATREAFVVHYADELDAIMNQFNGAPPKKDWEFNKMLQRYLKQSI